MDPVIKLYTNFQEAEVFGQKVKVVDFDPVTEVSRPLEQAGMEYKLSFDDVQVLGRKPSGLTEEGKPIWGYPNPTLFHLTLADFVKNKSLKPTIVDAGCGTGFLGNYAAKHLHPQKIIFADMNPYAIKQSIEAVHLNNGLAKLIDANPDRVVYKSDKEYEGRLGNILTSVDDVTEATFLSAPYFLPGIVEAFPQAFAIYSAAAVKNGNEIYFGHSDLSMPLLEDAASKAGANLQSNSIRTIPLSPEFYSEHLGRPEIEEGTAHKLMVSRLSPR
jgi:SAM-dependent methyltransferase